MRLVARVAACRPARPFGVTVETSQLLAKADFETSAVSMMALTFGFWLQVQHLVANR